MHPDILRELASQRGRELREQAHSATQARAARQAMRHGTGQADEFIMPDIPDYVDGSFQVEVPAARHAA
jgi:hypothetical protein